MTIEFELDGRPVGVPDGDRSLLVALREELGVRSVKDGCSPQGQCGCCTVLVDGAPRVSCVTPVARVRGRGVTTVDGLEGADRWAAAFRSTGASQCGFCTPGIITRLSTLTAERLADRAAVDKALLAHLCRCTGWQTIREACVVVARNDDTARPVGLTPSRRAEIEGGAAQQVGDDVALGHGGFAEDTAPADALVAVSTADGDWVVAETLVAALARAGKVQGRRTTAPPAWPIDAPEGSWSHVLRTTWVEPAYLEPDASWCFPGGEPASPAGNGGAFGGKHDADVAAVARRLADEHGRAVRVVRTREDTVRHGPKRPPLALGLRPDGTGTVLLARPTDPAEAEALRTSIAAVASGVNVEVVDAEGPPVSARLRAAGWGEVAAACAVVTGDPTSAVEVVSPTGAIAGASVDPVSGLVSVRVDAGDPLDPVVLRSYAIGAAHMALGMVRSESISLGTDGRPLDLTIRSFGVLRSVDTPRIEVEIVESDRPPCAGADAVFAAVLGAAWRAAGVPERIPTG